MTNKTLGYITLATLAGAYSCYYIGSYSEYLNAWDTAGDVASLAAVVLFIWCAIRLIRS